jgi:5-methylcytosine-specific restriction enzyme A
MSRNRFQHFYGSRHWRRLAAAQLRREPLCVECLRKGVVTPAVQADHVERHHGNATAFFTNRLQSLCGACHAVKTGIEEGVRARGFSTEIDERGWPVDKRHPCWRKNHASH